MCWSPFKFYLLSGKEGQWFNYLCEILDKFPVVPTNPRKARTCLGVVVGCIFWMACVFEGNSQMPFMLRICPKYWISLEKKWHLLNFIESFAACSFSNTCLMWDRCSAVLLNIIMSSMYAIAKLKSFKIPVVNSWKYAGVWASPNGTLMYSYLPKGELNAILGIEDLSKGIWW